MKRYLFFALLLLFWLFVQFYLVRVYGGVVTAVDSPLYINDAKLLLTGTLPERRSIWYIGYSLFLSVVFYFRGSLEAAVFWQVAISGVATVCLYILTLDISKDKLSAWIAVFIYLLWVKIHHWNMFIYSESLFTSFGIISFTALIKSKKPWHYGLSALLLLYTFFIRPSGFGYLVGLLFYGFSFVNYRQFSKWGIAALTLLMVAGAALLLNKMLTAYILVESYARAEIIYPNITLGVEPPLDLVIPPDSYTPLIRLVLFVLHNPLYFAKISLIKLGLFLGNVKPYFSLLHNLVIVSILYPLYFFAVKGFIHLSHLAKSRYFIAGYVLAQALTVTLTTENWDGRFLVPVLPFIFILSAIGITQLIRKKILRSRIISPLSYGRRH